MHEGRAVIGRSIVGGDNDCPSVSVLSFGKVMRVTESNGLGRNAKNCASEAMPNYARQALALSQMT